MMKLKKYKINKKKSKLMQIFQTWINFSNTQTCEILHSSLANKLNF
jgi:hypothetical protein